jgi:hypothetical protein
LSPVCHRLKCETLLNFCLTPFGICPTPHLVLWC